MLVLARQRVAEILRAPSDSVLMRAVRRNLGQPVGNLVRRVKVREALLQVDRTVLVGHARHAAYYGIGECGRAARKFAHDALPHFR